MQIKRKKKKKENKNISDPKPLPPSFQGWGKYQFTSESQIYFSMIQSIHNNKSFLQDFICFANACHIFLRGCLFNLTAIDLLVLWFCQQAV